MPIICFFGPDGSGKTSLAKTLAKHLGTKGFKVKFSWMRGTHTFAYVLAQVLSRFNTFNGPDNPYYGISIPKKFTRIWQIIEFISVMPVILLRIILPSVAGYCVVSERCIPDFLAWISVTTNDKNYLDRIEAKFLLALSAKSNLKVFIVADLNTLLIRRGESNIGFINSQLKQYMEIAQIIDAFILDTTGKDVTNSSEQIKSLISHLRPTKIGFKYQ